MGVMGYKINKSKETCRESYHIQLFLEIGKWMTNIKSYFSLSDSTALQRRENNSTCKMFPYLYCNLFLYPIQPHDSTTVTVVLFCEDNI